MDENNLDATREFKVETLVEEVILSEESIDEELKIITFDEVKKTIKTNPFKKLFEKFMELKPIFKILIIGGILLLITGSILLIWFLNKETKNPKEEEKEKNTEIVVKDNYRYENGILTILNNNDESIGTYTCTNKDETKCYVSYILDDDNFNISKKILENSETFKERSKVYHDRYVFIYDNKNEDNGVIILYDLEQSKELDSFIGIKHYNTSNQNIIILKNKENKYGVLELNADGLNTILEYKYDYLGILDKNTNDGIVVTKENNSWNIITFAGKTLVKGIEYEIKDFNDKFIVVSNNEKLYLMDYTKNFISSEAFLHIELLDGYNLFVNTDNKLFIKDISENKMLEEGIPLFNHDYTKTIVYNKDGKQIETKFSYTYELINKKLNFIISDGEKTIDKSINLMEGIISAKQNFYSYFDGIIYIYRDGDKNELIGQYNCSNKNSLTDSSTEFDKCFLASDESHDDNDMTDRLNTTSIIPIFNERFVFIRDSELLATEEAKINLYDISIKKTLATYVYVNTYSKANNNAIYHENVTKKIIVAKSKKGMGAIVLTADSVGSILDFKYDSVERLGEYLLVKLNSKWQIKLDETTDISAEFSEQIRGYNGQFLKTKSGGKYKIYGLNSTTPTLTGFNYIEINNNIVAAVNSTNQIELYKTDGTLIAKDREDLKLNSTDYYGVKELAFTLKVDAGTITVNIKGKVQSIIIPITDNNG